MEWTCGKHWLGTGTYINIALQQHLQCTLCIVQTQLTIGCGKHCLDTGTYINIYGSICIGNYMHLQIQGLTQELDATQY